MSTFLIVLFTVVGILALYALVAPTLLGMPRYMRARRLACPHHPAMARVNVDAARAALTSVYGAPDLRVSRCSLLGKGETCDQGCLHETPRAVNA